VLLIKTESFCWFALVYRRRASFVNCVYAFGQALKRFFDKQLQIERQMILPLEYVE